MWQKQKEERKPLIYVGKLQDLPKKDLLTHDASLCSTEKKGKKIKSTIFSDLTNSATGWEI